MRPLKGNRLLPRSCTSRDSDCQRRRYRPFKAQPNSQRTNENGRLRGLRLDGNRMRFAKSNDAQQVPAGMLGPPSCYSSAPPKRLHFYPDRWGLRRADNSCHGDLCPDCHLRSSLALPLGETIVRFRSRFARANWGKIKTIGGSRRDAWCETVWAADRNMQCRVQFHKYRTYAHRIGVRRRTIKQLKSNNHERESS